MRLPQSLRDRAVLVVGPPRDSSRNYMDKVLGLAATVPVGESGRYDVIVRHDRDCPAIHGGGYCACDPNVSMKRVEAWPKGG